MKRVPPGCRAHSGEPGEWRQAPPLGAWTHACARAKMAAVWQYGKQTPSNEYGHHYDANYYYDAAADGD